MLRVCWIVANIVVAISFIFVNSLLTPARVESLVMMVNGLDFGGLYKLHTN